MITCCCCLPTPLALASGGGPIFLLVVHLSASPSIWPVRSAHKSSAYVGTDEEMMCVVCVNVTKGA